MENKKIEQGADIVVKNWLRLRKWEKMLVVTSDTHKKEAEILQRCAIEKGCRADLMVVEKKGKHVGMFFDDNKTAFSGYHAIVGATDYSLVTTKAAKYAIKRGSKFLSLPLSTNDGRSMLEYDFMKADTKKTRMMAGIIMKYLNHSSVVRITTKSGTDLKFYKRKRKAGLFNGTVREGNRFSSASIEIYIPVEETMTEGVMSVDGSLGYIGKIKDPFKVFFKKGRISYIEKNEDGKKLEDYMKGFDDERIYIAGELGIGLNSYSECKGNCYIEDESAYGTFHIGLGRNIALGGKQEATGHFDIVAKEPDIYADNRMIMEKGKIIIPEPEVY